ncbi:MAG: hypothetical protein COB39_02855 [Marinosulfonomonas sp.]|nr:MAG: hypothetical protein COB39_02855 [Marinosulfonomonas sp.]
MRTPIAAILLGTLILTGCATNFNPFNWFGRGSTEETLTVVVDPDAIIDHRDMVDQVTSLNIEKTGGGAIIHAVGLPLTQGFWDAELIPENGERPVNGVLTYQFRINQPVGFERASTTRSREVVVGYFVSSFKLNGVSQIRVIGVRNARTSRR